MISDDVPHRAFKTADHRLWHVWQVDPDESALEYLREGWLCFESGDDRRRFAPIPHGWETLPDAVLCVMLGVAADVPKRASA